MYRVDLRFRRLTPTPAVNTHLIIDIIHAFCLEIPNLNRHDFNEIAACAMTILSAQERRAILDHVFCDEVLAGMFFKAYCKYLTSGIHPALEQTPSYDDSPPSEDITLRIAQFLHLIVPDGPEPLIRMLSSPGILETLISTTLYACQYSRCNGGPDGRYRFGHPFLFTIRTIT